MFARQFVRRKLFYSDYNMIVKQQLFTTLSKSTKSVYYYEREPVRCCILLFDLAAFVHRVLITYVDPKTVGEYDDFNTLHIIQVQYKY